MLVLTIYTRLVQDKKRQDIGEYHGHIDYDTRYWYKVVKNKVKSDAYEYYINRKVKNQP